MGLVPVSKFWRRHAARPQEAGRDWTQQELAQFYRVEWALGQAGLGVDLERGLTDEGDPWIAFCRSGDGEVVIHIAREGETYVLAGFMAGRVQRGRDFTALVEQVLEKQPAKALDKRGQTNVIMHPATLLALLVSIAILQSEEGNAAAVGPNGFVESGAVGRGASHQSSPSASIASAVTASQAPAAVAAPSLLIRSVSVPGSSTSISATLELSQAMTLLRVASVLNQLPIESDLTFALAHREPAYVERSPHAGDSAHEAARDTTSKEQPGESASSVGVVDASEVVSASKGVEKLLEVLIKLWSVADVPANAPLAVAAATSFFSGNAAALQDVVFDRDVSQSGVQQIMPTAALGVTGASNHAGDETALAQVHVTVVHSQGSSETIAKTMLKLSVSGQPDQVVPLGSGVTPGKLVSLLADIVTQAKSSAGLDASPAHSTAGTTGPVDVKPNVKATKLLETVADAADAEAVETVDPAVAEPEISGQVAGASKSYTTAISDSVTAHSVLTDDGEIAVSRAIAAFKEDVDRYSVAFSGRDVIFYSPDAVINHSNKVVVELWQFKDGSSISLVGLSVDGGLPYSL